VRISEKHCHAQDNTTVQYRSCAQIAVKKLIVCPSSNLCVRELEQSANHHYSVHISLSLSSREYATTIVPSRWKALLTPDSVDRDSKQRSGYTLPQLLAERVARVTRVQLSFVTEIQTVDVLQ